MLWSRCILLVTLVTASGCVADQTVGADERPGATLSQASGAPLTTGQPTPLTPPVPPPDAMPVTPNPGGTSEGPRPPGAQFQCPKTRYVDCMPPVQNGRRESCTREYLEWMKAHCPNSQVVY